MTKDDLNIIKDPDSWPEAPYLDLINHTRKEVRTLRVVLDERNPNGWRIDMSYSDHELTPWRDVPLDEFELPRWKGWTILR